MAVLKTMFKALAITSFTVVVGMGITTGGLYLLQKYESDLFPIVEDFNVDHILLSENEIMIAGDMNKLRPCKAIGLYPYFVEKGTTVRKDNIIRHEGNRPFYSRPVGHQTFGPHRFDNSNNAGIDGDVYLFVRHRCHLLWETDTLLAKIPIKHE